jgi:hypothetical protein
MVESQSNFVVVHHPALVAVKPLEDGVIELGQLLRRHHHVDAEVGLDQPHRLEGPPELPAREKSSYNGGRRR